MTSARWIALTSALLMVFAGSVGHTKSKIEKRKLESMGAKLGTDFRMSGLNISGNYKSANVGLATVENDKPLNDLLDYDRDFKARSEAARSWK
jgi:hypothetical protein